jgi:hypothetical protein
VRGLFPLQLFPLHFTKEKVAGIFSHFFISTRSGRRVGSGVGGGPLGCSYIPDTLFRGLNDSEVY